jgi:hypothetical protein
MTEKARVRLRQGWPTPIEIGRELAHSSPDEDWRWLCRVQALAEQRGCPLEERVGRFVSQAEIAGLERCPTTI